jgi:hypothetical protein
VESKSDVAASVADATATKLAVKVLRVKTRKTVRLHRVASRDKHHGQASLVRLVRRE